jgi:hypothetical protein
MSPRLIDVAVCDAVRLRDSRLNDVHQNAPSVFLLQMKRFVNEREHTGIAATKIHQQ